MEDGSGVHVTAPEMLIDCMDPVYREWLEEHPDCGRAEMDDLTGPRVKKHTERMQQEAREHRGKFPGDRESEAFNRDAGIYAMDSMLRAYGPRVGADAKYLFAREKNLIRTGPEMEGLDTYVPR